MTLIEAADFLDAVANKLDRWARDSVSGGWSTHQVKPNREMADECRRTAAQCRETSQR